MKKNNAKRRVGVFAASLSLIATTALASVTGAVAWFTATRSVSATATSFTAYDENGTLTITTEDSSLIGVTKASGSNANVETTNVLTDASYDAIHQELWSDVQDTDSGNANPTNFTLQAASEEGYNSKKTTPDNKKIYYAMSWTWTLTYKVSSAKKSVLLLDPTHAKTYINGTASKDGALTTLEGFRLALNVSAETSANATAATRPVILGTGDTVTFKTRHAGGVSSATAKTVEKDGSYDLSDSTFTASYTQSSAVTADSTSAYIKLTDSNLKDKESDDQTLDSFKALPYYLGEFDTASTNKTSKTCSLKVKCTAWYEGTDKTHIITSDTISKIAADVGVGFYVRNASN